jgi:hypothetical protein
MKIRIIIRNILSVIIAIMIVSSVTAINISNNKEIKRDLIEEENCYKINPYSRNIRNILKNYNSNNTTVYSGNINGSGCCNSSLVAFPILFFTRGSEIFALWIGITFIIGWTASGENIDFVIAGENITYEHEGFIILFLGGCYYNLNKGSITIEGWSPYISITKI